MKRIVRLTESDLVKLVKRVISEQATMTSCLEPLQTHLEGQMNLGPTFKDAQKKQYRDALVRDCTALEAYVKSKPTLQFGADVLRTDKTVQACVVAVNFGNTQMDKDMETALAKVGTFVNCVKSSNVGAR